jgi:hypothetical protein
MSFSHSLYYVYVLLIDPSCVDGVFRWTNSKAFDRSIDYTNASVLYMHLDENQRTFLITIAIKADTSL